MARAAKAPVKPSFHEEHNPTCDHDIALCKHCDVVYCRACSAQWAKPCTLPHYWYSPWWYGNGGTWTVTGQTNELVSVPYNQTIAYHEHEVTP